LIALAVSSDCSGGIPISLSLLEKKFLICSRRKYIEKYKEDNDSLALKNVRKKEPEQMLNETGYGSASNGNMLDTGSYHIAFSLKIKRNFLVAL
jgi:hypothetical protein